MPWKLWVAVGSLLALDLVLLVTWSLVDPLRRQVHNFATEKGDPEDDVEIQPQLEHCKSTHHTVWLGKINVIYILLKTDGANVHLKEILQKISPKII